jgi:hypothetical protein
MCFNGDPVEPEIDLSTNEVTMSRLAICLVFSLVLSVRDLLAEGEPRYTVHFDQEKLYGDIKEVFVDADLVIQGNVVRRLPERLEYPYMPQVNKETGDVSWVRNVEVEPIHLVDFEVKVLEVYKGELSQGTSLIIERLSDNIEGIPVNGEFYWMHQGGDFVLFLTQSFDLGSRKEK